MKYEKTEIIKLVLLNSKMEILRIIDVAHGGIGFANVTQSEIISQALRLNVPNIILVHNHPSGDSTPSKADIEFTKNLYNSAQNLNIELVDHVVIAANGYKSVVEELRKNKKDVK